MGAVILRQLELAGYKNFLLRSLAELELTLGCRKERARVGLRFFALQKKLTQPSENWYIIYCELS